MRLIELPDAVSFLKSSSRILLNSTESEAENNLLLSSVMTLARSSAMSSNRLSFLAVEKQGETQLVALNVKDRRLTVSTGDVECAFYLGKKVAELQALNPSQMKIKGLFAPTPIGEAFARGWLIQSNLPQKLMQNQYAMKLDRKLASSNFENASSLAREVHGLCRIALPKDQKLLSHWSRNFAKECNLDESTEESEEAIRRNLELRQLFIWEDRRPVAMAGFGGLTPKGARVNMVYTDPAARSKGYAKALVQNISLRILAQADRKFCFLFVESTNRAAIKVYEELGYRKLGAFSDYLL